MINDLEFLFSKIRQLEKNNDNIRRKKAWKPNKNSADAFWHGHPRDNLHFIPFIIEPEYEMWSQIINYPLAESFKDYKTFLLSDLNKKIFHFENFKDTSPIGRTVSLWMGVGFEASLFGMEQKYTKNQVPWVGREPFLKEKNLDKLEMPDFYLSSSMKLVHLMYERIKESLENDFTVLIQDWGRGPFGVACHLRGMEKLSIDMIDDPQFVMDLMLVINEGRKKWAKQRADFMKVPIQPSSLYNDEVNIPLLSPKMYENFVLPYEIELSKFYGGINYWHSCGNTTELQNLIKCIPNLEIYHVGPWTDIKQSVSNFKDTDVVLEIALHPLKDVQTATNEEVVSYLNFIKNITTGIPVTIRADGLQVITTVENDINTIKKWAKTANEILCNN